MGTTRREHCGVRDEFRGCDMIIKWGLLYNLFADRLLGFNVFPQSVYDLRKFFSFRVPLQ